MTGTQYIASKYITHKNSVNISYIYDIHMSTVYSYALCI